MSIAHLEGDKYILTYCTDATNRDLYGQICTITETTISVGGSYLIQTLTSYSPYVVALTATSAIVVYKELSGGDAEAFGMTISGTVITVGGVATLDVTTAEPSMIVRLSDTSALALVNNGTANGINLYVLTLSGANISGVYGIPSNPFSGTDTYGNPYYNYQLVEISANTFLMTYKAGSVYYHVVVTVSGTTISLGTPLSSGVTISSQEMDVHRLSDSKFLFVPD
jgi:hypothetical protein